jgi:hypothetical protein
LRTKLFRIPAHDLSKRFRNSVRLFAGHQRQELPLAIALDELDGYVEVEQAIERLTGHRARQHIAPDHYSVYLGSPKILENSFKRWEVSMDIVERGNPHNRPSWHDTLAGLTKFHVVTGDAPVIAWFEAAM